jgi:glycosyltransferase involved in cell wall biosynthesis
MSLVSVIIPTLNRKEYLKQAIESVQDQTYNSIQIVVVDGNSSDGTRNYLRSLNQPNVDLVLRDTAQGQSSARNKGMAEADGDLILFLDDDDMLLDGAVDKLVNVVKSSPDKCAGAFASEKRFGQSNEVHRVLSGKVENTYNLDFGTSCSMFRADVLDEVEGFDESLKSSEDLDLVIRIFSKGYHLHGIHKALYKRRMHDGQISRRINQNLDAWKIILEKHSDTLSAKEKIEWEKTVSWGRNKLDQTKLASKSVQRSIELLGQNITDLDDEKAASLINSILHQCRILDDQDLTVSCLESLETIINNQDSLFKSDESYANLGLEFAGTGECQRARKCLIKSIKSNPKGVYKYYFLFWITGGKKGYLTGRKLESLVKSNPSPHLNKMYE